MRVHELDEAYEVSKETVKEALELAGLSTHHLSKMDAEEIELFETALNEIREKEEEDLQQSLDDFESALASEPSPLPEFSDEEKEHDGTGVPMEAVEADPGEWTELESEEFDEADLEPEDIIHTVVGEGEFEHTPESDVFPVCNDRGAFVENCLLPPDLAAKVRAILGKNRINSYLLDLDRGEFVFVVWEEARKYSVRIDEDE